MRPEYQPIGPASPPPSGLKGQARRKEVYQWRKKNRICTQCGTLSTTFFGVDQKISLICMPCKVKRVDYEKHGPKPKKPPKTYEELVAERLAHNAKRKAESPEDREQRRAARYRVEMERRRKRELEKTLSEKLSDV